MPEPRVDVIRAAEDLAGLVRDAHEEAEGTWAEGALDPSVAEKFAEAALALADLAGTLEGAVPQTPEVRKVVSDLDRTADGIVRSRSAIEASLARRGASTEEKLMAGDDAVARIYRYLESRRIPFRRGRTEI